MKTFSEEFVEELGYLTQEQLKRSNILKDAIRENVLSSAAEIWKKVLEDENASLIPMTLQVMRHYIAWIPLGLSLQFFTYFVKFLNNADTQIPALQCIDSIVNKKLEPLKKFEIIQRLNLVGFIQSFSFGSFDMLSDIPKTMANLIDSLGIYLLDVEASIELKIVLDCSFECLNNVKLI